MNKQIIYYFVDRGLKSLEELDIIRIPHDGMPQEMVYESKERRNDWISWKPIKSTVTDSDLMEFEKLAGRQLPDSYKEFRWICSNFNGAKIGTRTSVRI